VPGLCLNTWYMFCLGVFACWTYRRFVPRWLGGLLLSCIALSLLTGFGWSKLAAVLTASVILLASHCGTLESWLKGRVFQFFGRISYSLYLIHGAVGWGVLSIGERLTGRQVSFSLLWLCLAIASSIVAAYVMYLYIELPSSRLSRRLKYE